MHVSHGTIYRTLFLQTRGALKRELMAHLRIIRPIRRREKIGAPRAQSGTNPRCRLHRRAASQRRRSRGTGALGRRPDSGRQRLEREHERAAPAVFPEGHRPLQLHAAAAERRRTAIEHAPAENPWVENTRRYVTRSCCNDRLNPPRHARPRALLMISVGRLTQPAYAQVPPVTLLSIL